MKRFNLIPFIILCCCYSLNAGAQEYSYKHYDIRDGLVGNNVYTTVEDKEGFLWFATETGVSRFDGTSFKNFTTSDGLPDNEILKLFVDSKGRIWMLPFKKEICYYFQGKIHNRLNDPQLSSLKISERILDINEDTKGNLFFFEWLGMTVLQKNERVLRYDYEKKEGVYPVGYGSGMTNLHEEAVFVENPGEPTTLYNIIIDSNKILLKKTDESIKFWGNKWNFAYINPWLLGYLGNYKNRNDVSGMIFHNYLQNKNDSIKLPAAFNLISVLNDSILFFNTGYGSVEYNFRRNITSDHFLKEENISCTLKDQEGNLWFTTLGNGIYRLHSQWSKNIFLSENNSKNSVEAILVNDKKIIIGTKNSKIYGIDKKTLALTSYDNISPDTEVKKTVKMLQYNEKIYFLFENYLVTTDNDIRNPKIVSTYPPPNDKHYAYKDMDINKNEEIVLATHKVGVAYSLNKKIADDILYDGRCTSVCAADSGVYFGTITGLKFVAADKKVSDIGDGFQLLKSRVTKLLYSRGKIWVGTNDNGVICFNGKKIEKVISVTNGLTGNLVRALFADGNYLWVGTDRGLNKISLNDSSYPVLQVYSTGDGITSNMINAVFVQHDTVYVGTPEGLSFFNEKQLNSKSSCDFKIEGITVSNNEIHFDSSKLYLGHRDNNIRFDFVAISYKSEGNILYYYKLSGIDPAWKTTKENFLQYPSLPSGNYSMQFYAVNKFGARSKTVTINFEIEKMLFEQTWFIVLIILISVFIAWLLANWQIRRLKKFQKEKTASSEKIAQLEQQALKAQMNPHFIFNCLNSIQQYVIDKDVQGANKFISGFSKLIRQTLDNSGKQSITVAEEESFLRSYLELEKSRFEDKFDYGISIDENIKKDEDSLPPMLLQPYIENCIRHGIMHKSNGKGIIDIRFNLSGRKLVCTISDNGIGRQASNAFKGKQHINYQSMGTDITWQRIKMINKNKDMDIILQTEDLVDTDQQPCGTKVTVVIPLEKTD